MLHLNDKVANANGGQNFAHEAEAVGVRQHLVVRARNVEVLCEQSAGPVLTGTRTTVTRMRTRKEHNPRSQEDDIR